MNSVRQKLLILGCLVISLIAFPLPIFLFISRDPARYFAFPPVEQFISPGSFSLTAFVFLSLIISVALAPFVVRACICTRTAKAQENKRGSFPLSGWIAVGLLVVSWIVAWTRFPAFSFFQHHTFIPLWCSYIIIMNALGVRFTASSPFRRQPRQYLALFPASACAWWLFEYLNRFAGNWSYQNIEHFSALEYFLFATISFSTVLPALAATKYWLSHALPFLNAFENWVPVKGLARKNTAILILLCSAFFLLLLPIFPEFLFPFVWLAPLGLLASLCVLYSFKTFLLDPAATPQGNWREIVSWALAALFCGFFWELWNYGSLAHWIYHIPYVDSGRIFAMPILGYAGYLPFGVFCGGVIALLSSE